ncbi:GAF domain-containing protein [Amycolatopsis sp. cg5]|uniref:GAF domain-containing protein n=1 Tax=Amycolatopsis sp. cg5 TaxID=3238802 RepID=UPI0035259A05
MFIVTDPAESPNHTGSPHPSATDDVLAALLDRAAQHQAAMVLMERYDLPDPATATHAMATAARRHGRAVGAVARALLIAPEPRRAARSWFPSRVWTSAPPVGFLAGSAATRPQDVLDAAVDAATGYAQTAQGDIQTVTPVRGGLDLRQARGFSPAFVRQFAHVDGDETACAIALNTRRSVTVPDVTRCDIFDRPALETLARAEIRAVHSVPILAGGGAGVVSVHYPRPGATPSHATRVALSGIAAQTGAWLQWYGRTAMLDALEDLHQHACRFPAM